MVPIQQSQVQLSYIKGWTSSASALIVNDCAGYNVLGAFVFSSTIVSKTYSLPPNTLGIRLEFTFWKYDILK